MTSHKCYSLKIYMSLVCDVSILILVHNWPLRLAVFTNSWETEKVGYVPLNKIALAHIVRKNYSPIRSITHI